MEELKRLMGRFITPTIIIHGQALLGFGPNLGLIRDLVEAHEA